MEDGVQQEQREASLRRHAGDAADRHVRAASAVEELHVDVDRRAVPAAADRYPVSHLVEVQRLGALNARRPAHHLARRGGTYTSGSTRVVLTSAISWIRAGSTPSEMRKTSEPKLAPSCLARTWVTMPLVSTGPIPGTCRNVTTTSSSCR